MRIKNVLEDSVIYQSIKREGFAMGFSGGREIGIEIGKLDALWTFIVRAGNSKFGVPSQTDLKKLLDVRQVEDLERMADRIFDATSWADLLSTP